MPFFETADRTRLYYTDWGTGAPAVFVSCWAAGGAIWEWHGSASPCHRCTGRRPT